MELAGDEVVVRVEERLLVHVYGVISILKGFVSLHVFLLSFVSQSFRVVVFWVSRIQFDRLSIVIMGEVILRLTQVNVSTLIEELGVRLI